MFSGVKTIIHLMACYETDTLLIVTCESSWFEHPVVVRFHFAKRSSQCQKQVAHKIGTTSSQLQN